jgi:two-component system chemotaxis sensor kinase CheA
VGNEKYAVPIGDIQSIEDVNRADVKKVQKRDMMPFNDMIIPIIWLDEVLGIKNKNNAENLIVLIAKRGDRYVGVVVDDLLDNQELVVKQISEYIENTKKMFSGATILGDGKVALILNIDALY